MGMENLTRLSLWNNSLMGSLPREWGQLGCLTDLDINLNNLSGTLPAQWMGMENLTRLILKNNSLVGTLPSEWGQLRRLEVLDINSNFLNGTLPAQWMGMEGLKALHLGKNSLVGTLPSEWGQLRRRLAFLAIMSNRLTGSLPSDARLAEFTFLSDNRLSGSLPSNMSGVRLLDLSRNLLSGALPDPLTAPDLEALYIGGNRLQKPVPDCWLYHRSCLPVLTLYSDGGLLRESASSYSWRRRNCRDELAFQWGDLSNVTHAFQRFLDKFGVDRNNPFRAIPVDAQQADIKMPVQQSKRFASSRKPLGRLPCARLGGLCPEEGGSSPGGGLF
eukprot:jgi/Botrbrau1/11642/Bobra.0209s0032.1